MDISRAVRTLRGVASACVLVFGVPASYAQDLNGNNQPDSLELRQGAADCNHNGVLDPIDIGHPHFSGAIEHLNGVNAFQNNVWDVTPIDFNLDGRMDLAFTIFFGTNEGRIALWRNDGGPGLVFQSEISFVERRPYAIDAGDLNGDGRTDLVASDSSFNRVYVLLATGPGTFAAPVILSGDASNNGSVGVALGDVDNDGDLDVAASSWGTNTINVWKNNGNGTFGARSTYPVSFQPRDLAIGDFTGDGFADIAVANEFYSANPPSADGTVSLLRNTGAGAFVPAGIVTPPRGLAPYGYQPRPRFVKLFDIDHDGDRDLIVSSDGSNIVSIHRNGGAGVFSLVQSFGGYPIEVDPTDVAIADLDGDGWEEVVYGEQASSGMNILRNEQGTLSLHQSYASGLFGPLFVTLADLTGDGLPEMVSTNDAARTFSVLENTRNLTFDAPVRLRLAEYTYNGILEDFTGDGITDFGAAVENQAGTTVHFTVYRGVGPAGEARFDPTSVSSTFVGDVSAFTFARDLNNDGVLDLLTVNGQCTAHLGNGDGTFQGPISSPIQPRALRLAIADFNVDGALDLMWIVSGHPGSALVSFGDGAGAFGAPTSYTMLAEDESVGFGDITGDGAPEFFAGFRPQSTPPGGVLSWLPNNGNGAFGPRQDRFINATPLGPAVAAIAVADFDGDGDRDVAVSALGLRLFRNPGNGDLPATPDLVNPVAGSILTPADIDLDGDIDLFARNTTLSLLLNTGSGAFAPAMNLHRYDSNYRDMYVADANNDGRLDAMIRPENSWSQYIFLNGGPASEDVNGSGIPDECEGLRCRSDVNGDDFVDSNDVSEFINQWFSNLADGGRAADFDENGEVNSGDVSSFLNMWFSDRGSGCGV